MFSVRSASRRDIRSMMCVYGFPSLVHKIHERFFFVKFEKVTKSNEFEAEESSMRADPQLKDKA